MGEEGLGTSGAVAPRISGLRPTLLLTAWGVLLVLLAGARPAPSPLQGPIADFWNQVKRDWARALPGLRSGPGQTMQWISLVYGMPGQDEALDDLLQREMQTWASLMQRQWIRSMFWKKPYHRLDREGFYGSRALGKNLVVMGTPASNPLVAEMTRRTPFRVEGESVWIDGREYRGPSLLLVFLRPNPLGEGTYTLVFAATREEALLHIARLPLGATDYVLFRGTHPVAAGFLDWSRPEDLALGGDPQVFPDHHGWEEVVAGPVRVHFNPDELRPEQAHRFARDRAEGLRRLGGFFGADPGETVDEFLYASLDDKMRQASEPGPVSVDLAGGAVHRVWRPGGRAPDWPLAMVLIWRSWGPTDLQGLLFGLSVLPEGTVEGQPLDAWASRLVERGDVPSVESLLARGPWDPGGGDEGSALEVLALAAFLEHLVGDRGLATLESFYRLARARNFRRAFREVMGTSLGRAESRWRQGLPPQRAGSDPVEPDPSGNPADQAARASALLAGGEELFLRRADGEAAERLGQALELDSGLARARVLLARIAFRAGRDGEAIAEATEAIRLGEDDPSVVAWARLTLGRAHALQGDHQSARLELTDPSLAHGPPEARILADYWLEHLGLSPNRASAARYLTRQAEIDLQRYDWESAERRALQMLAADPGNGPAHHLLARIRLEKFRYWHDFALLYNELFPTTEPSDPFQYFYLVQSAERESYKGAYLEQGTHSPLDLDLAGALPPPEGVGRARDLILTSPRAGREGQDEAYQHVLRAQADFLAGDCHRAASHLEAALELGVPVSDYRAGILYLLGRCEQELGQGEDGRAHLEEARSIARKKALKEKIERALAEPAGRRQ